MLSEHRAHCWASSCTPRALLVLVAIAKRVGERHLDSQLGTLVLAIQNDVVSQVTHIRILVMRSRETMDLKLASELAAGSNRSAVLYS